MEDDKDYFYKRAENELEMAQRTEVPEAVKAHYTLAGFYLDKVYTEEETPADDQNATDVEGDSR